MRVYKPRFKKRRSDGTQYEYESPYYYMEFEFEGRVIHQTTRLKDKKKAESLMAKHRTALVMGEAGIKPKKPIPTLADFLDRDFVPYYRRTKAEREPNTFLDYSMCAEHLKDFTRLSRLALNEIDHDAVQAFIEHRQAYRKPNGRPLEVSTINHDLRTLRRALKLAEEWDRVDRIKVKIKLLPGENRRDRALSEAESSAYLNAATAIAHKIEREYDAALVGIRAVVRGEQPRKPDAYRFRDAVLLMLEGGLRPEEVRVLKAENIRDGAIYITESKTPAGVRRIPFLTDRLRECIEMRVADTPPGGWLFPNSDTKSGHMEESSLSSSPSAHSPGGPHEKAIEMTGLAYFPIYTLRHTCLTNWGEYMDPWRLKRYAGHEDLKTTMRYIHPRDEDMDTAMARHREAQAVKAARAAQGPATSGETAKSDNSARTVVSALKQ